MDVMIRGVLAHEWKYVVLCLRETAFKNAIVGDTTSLTIGVRELNRLADIIESNLLAVAAQ